MKRTSGSKSSGGTGRKSKTSSISVEIPTSLALLEERLREFFQGMIYKLEMNAHKRTPEISDIPSMTEMLRVELKEFVDQFEENKHDVNTLIELFDTSNFAFLIFVALRNQGHADWRNTPEKEID
jgi:hypothetical protein